MLSDPTVNCLYCGSRATHQCNLSPYGYTDYCMAATSQFWVFIGQKMQLTDWENANNMRNATCADTQILNEWPYCSFLYCAFCSLELRLHHFKLRPVACERKTIIQLFTSILLSNWQSCFKSFDLILILEPTWPDIDAKFSGYRHKHFEEKYRETPVFSLL